MKVENWSKLKVTHFVIIAGCLKFCIVRFFHMNDLFLYTGFDDIGIGTGLFVGKCLVSLFGCEFFVMNL